MKEAEDSKTGTPLSTGEGQGVRRKKTSFADDVNEWISLDKVLEYLPFILFLAVLGMFYTGSRLHAEKQIRNASAIEKELKKKQWEYNSTKSELMYSSMQSVVASKLEINGLKELVRPPKKIVTEEK